MRLAVAAAVLALPGAAAADVHAWRPRVDIEPAAWFLHGYSVHVGVQPPAFPRVLLSTGAYAFDMPAMLVTMSGEDPDRFDGRLTFGAGAFADVFVGEHVDRGWVVGAQVGVQRYRIDDKMLATEHTADRALLLLRAGYEWHPRGVGGYIFPWAGAAITHEVSGDAGAYAQWPIVPYVTLDLGWRY